MRSPVPADSLLRLIAEGSLPTPRADQPLAPGAAQIWKTITPNDKGVLSGDRLVGGWVATTVHADSAHIMLLNAAGSGLTLVNGVPRTGDAYRMGWVGLPVMLEAGDNQLLFRVARGELSFDLSEPPRPIFLTGRDATLPDLRAGAPGDGDSLWASVIVTNATNAPRPGLSISAVCPESEPIITALPTLTPLSIHKAAFRFLCRSVPLSGTVPLHLTLIDGTGAVDELVVDLPVKPAGAVYKRTFQSRIEGSVQYYAMNEATPPRAPAAGSTAPPGILLSLHGASVEATSQASCYSPREWAHVVAPTNRRPYGFDWEDWGRWDACEALADAREHLPGVSPQLWLTGHSMGGHGTWQLGALMPGSFAAIAPSAGWISFETYVGIVPVSTTTNALEQMFVRAAAPSNTLAWLDNLAEQPVYILHGDIDDNVPVDQARRMRSELAKFHADLGYHEQAGASHWWGNQCVDWPPLMQFLREHPAVDAAARTHIRFRTPSPAVLPGVGWARVETQHRSGIASGVDISLDAAKAKVSADLENVEVLAISPPPGMDREHPVELEVDHQSLGQPAWPQNGPLRLRQSGGEKGHWEVVTSAELPPLRKTPERAGPFKSAFDHLPLLVYGTRGTPEMNAWALAKARYDSESFAYRGNATFEIASDVDAPKILSAGPDRSVILYGDAASNAMYATLLPQCPVRAESAKVRVGEKVLEGDSFGVFVVYPRPGSNVAQVAVIAGTGLPGARAASFIPLFLAGVALPDWCVLTPDALGAGPAGVAAAGFFGPDWKFSSSDAAFAQ